MNHPKGLYAWVSEKVLYSKFLRAIGLPIFRKAVNRYIASEGFPEGLTKKRQEFFNAVLNSLVRNIENGNIARKAVRGSLRRLYGRSDATSIRKKFEKKYGIKPPRFMTVAPTKKCNLKCIGCYAASTCEDRKLSYEVFDKLVNEAHNIMGQNYMVITGGEPFLYQDKDKTIFDIWRKYNDMIFMVYTNGTLITKDIAKKLAELGNVSPAFSVEGFEKETDFRRGKGVFKKILESMKNLREAGVPFGVSITATSKNIDLLLKDEIYDFFLKKQGAIYMWMFHLMPIGKAISDFKLMINPKQRVALYQNTERIMNSKDYFIADFWNSGHAAQGCIAYGRKYGYLYVDWDGKVMPCVFAPYYVDTIKDLYAKNKSIADALLSNFFKRGRAWQDSYGYADSKKTSNWLMPCSIRDHFENFKKNILTKDAKPEDEIAGEAMKSKVYEQVLVKFDKELEKLTNPIWKKGFDSNFDVKE